MQSSRSTSAQEINAKLTSEVSEFKKLVHALADDTASADDLLQAQAAWFDCFTQNKCDTLVSLPQMAENLQQFRRDNYFTEQPELVLAHVPNYLHHHPELLDPHFNQSFTPSFQIRAAQHINENPAWYAIGTVLLALVFAAKLKLINPMHWFSIFRKKPIESQKPDDLPDRENNQCASR
jgi:hypothetical protein